MEDVCSKVIGHMLNVQLAAAFETWRSHAKQQLRGKKIVDRVLKHWTHRTHAAVFENWRIHAKDLRHMEDVCSKVIGHMLNVQLAAAFETWRSRFQKANSGRENLCACDVPLDTSLERCCFRSLARLR